MEDREDKQKTAGLGTAGAEEIIIFIIILIVLFGALGAYIEKVASWYGSFLELIYSQNWRDINQNLATVFTFVNIGLVGFIVFAFLRYRSVAIHHIMAKKPEKIVLPREEIRASWEEIRRLANSPNPSDWNMAVLRADALLEDVLRRLGYEGLTIAERLKVVDSTKLPSLDRIWAAHRLRNMIAHDPLQQHTRETIVHTLRSFEQGLKELGMLEEKETRAHAAPHAAGGL